MNNFSKPDYGIDAPGVRRIMFFIGLAGIITLIFAIILRGYSSTMWIKLGEGIAILIACYGFGMSGYMTWKSRIGKLLTREYLVNTINTYRPWKGDERVLDVGCGRGLMLVGAAKRLTTGVATGVDIWSNEDQSNNSPDAALENARREDLEDRIKVKTADARSLPFPAASIDVITSHWVIHNLPLSEDRHSALKEIHRVLKPGGVAALADIACLGEYSAFFKQIGAEILEFDDGGWEAKILRFLTGGTFCPQAIFVRRR